MGGLGEERSEKSRGGRNVERKGQQQGPRLCMLEAVCGSQMMLAYSKMGRTSVG